jgi:hypothetical protein
LLAVARGDNDTHALIVGHHQGETVATFEEAQVQGNSAVGRFLCQYSLELLVSIAINYGPGPEFRRKSLGTAQLWKKAVAIGAFFRSIDLCAE